MAYSDEVMIAVLERVEKYTKNNVASNQVSIPLSTDDERDCFDYADYRQFIFGGSRRASSLSPAGKEQLYLLRLRQANRERENQRFEQENQRFIWETKRFIRESQRLGRERQRFTWEAKRFALEIERHSREKIKHGLDIIAIILAIISLLVSIITVGLLAYVPST